LRSYQINAEWIVKHGEAWDNSDAEGMKFFLNQGNDIIGLDKKEAAKWKNAVMPIIDNYIKEINSRGLNGKHIVDFAIKTLDTLQTRSGSNETWLLNWLSLHLNHHPIKMLLRSPVYQLPPPDFCHHLQACLRFLWWAEPFPGCAE